jgi:hypothetical protein
VVEVCSDVSEERAVVRAQFHLYCFPYKPVHAPRFSGEDYGTLVQDPVAEVCVVFRRP